MTRSENTILLKKYSILIHTLKLLFCHVLYKANNLNKVYTANYMLYKKNKKNRTTLLEENIGTNLVSCNLYVDNLNLYTNKNNYSLCTYSSLNLL